MFEGEANSLAQVEPPSLFERLFRMDKDNLITVLVAARL